MNGVSEELISVIVPVYKVEKYLDRCMESIVGQTYENLEIILVDDLCPDCAARCAMPGRSAIPASKWSTRKTAV